MAGFKSNKQRGFIEANEAKGTLGHGPGMVQPHNSLTTPHVAAAPANSLSMPHAPAMPGAHTDMSPQMAALHQMAANNAMKSAPAVPKQPVFEQQTISNSDAKNPFQKLRAKINKDGI